MADSWLLDTGFLVALLDARDPDHDACVQVWQALSGRIVTCEGVLVEAAWLLRRNRGGAGKALGLLESVEAEVVPPTPRRYRRAVELMDKYADVPMDLVDALLVAMAEERSIDGILTLDLRGFLTYRIRGRKRFRVLPES